MNNEQIISGTNQQTIRLRYTKVAFYVAGKFSRMATLEETAAVVKAWQESGNPVYESWSKRIK